MTWKDKYDIINFSFDGILFLFGKHYTLSEAKALLNEKEWDDIEEINNYIKVNHEWIHFGFVPNEDDEIVSGWNVLEKEPKDKRGCIKVTRLIK